MGTLKSATFDGKKINAKTVHGITIAPYKGKKSNAVKCVVLTGEALKQYKELFELTVGGKDGLRMADDSQIYVKNNRKGTRFILNRVFGAANWCLTAEQKKEQIAFSISLKHGFDNIVNYVKANCAPEIAETKPAKKQASAKKESAKTAIDSALSEMSKDELIAALKQLAS